MKAILIIGDGMADWPIKELSWKTPLEVAEKPSIDHLAKTGICGIMDPIAPGVPPGSDTATFALLGYDPFKVYSGRGALEAVGFGLEVSQSDVAFRCNFATVSDDLVVLDRRAGRIANEDAAKLAESLQRVTLENRQVTFTFKNTIEHRAALVLHGQKLSAAVSNSDPKKIGEKVLTVEPLNGSSEAKLTAEFLNKLTVKFHNVLNTHPVNKERVKRGLPPANIVLFRGAGTLPNLLAFPEIYEVDAACIAAVPLVRGVCKVAGLTIINVKGATGTVQTDYMAKAKSTVEALNNYDFLFLHVKATDVASHDGNFKQKIAAIEKIDEMLEYILSNVDLDSTYLVLTADHTTSTLTGKHEGDPVPVAITGPYVRRDNVNDFNERSCADGGLNRIRGVDLMPILMNLLGRTKQFGS